MRKKSVSLYGVAKTILSSSIIVHDWWKLQDYNLRELIDAFGVGALQRGIDAAKAEGELVPEEVQKALNKNGDKS